MAYYWYNDNTDIRGNHEVHKSSCKYMPDYRNASFIGEFEWDFQVMKEARKWEPSKKFDGCYFCMPSEHTG